jgi:hypothetical protein
MKLRSQNKQEVALIARHNEMSQAPVNCIYETTHRAMLQKDSLNTSLKLQFAKRVSHNRLHFTPTNSVKLRYASLRSIRLAYTCSTAFDF